MKVNSRMNASMASEGYITISEVVEHSGIARSTIYDAVLKGKIEHTQVGKRLYLLEKSLLEFLGPVVTKFYQDSRKKASAPEPIVAEKQNAKRRSKTANAQPA